MALSLPAATDAPLDPLRVPLHGICLIEASAGTGKTHTITTLYVRLLLERQLRVDQILVVTYTIAATAELRTRIRRRLHAAVGAFDGATSDDELTQLAANSHQLARAAQDRMRLLAALHTFDEAAIFTIHGFCQRVLQEWAFESGVSFDAELVTTQQELLSQIAADYWVRELANASAEVIAHLSRRNTTLESLTRLAALVTAQPTMTVVPAPATTDVPAANAAWEAARAPVAQIWRAERDEIIARLSDPGLNKNQYRETTIRETWVPGLDAIAERGEQLFDGFEKLTPAALQKATRKQRQTPTHRFFDACAQLWAADQARRRGYDQVARSFASGFVDYARRELRREKEAANIQYFDDLLQRVAEALGGAEGPRLAALVSAQFPAAMIDEFQDTDPTQYEIFQAMFSGADGVLCLIGDPKQAIYAFRGADVFTYIRAKRDAGGLPHTLNTNRRSDAGLVRAVNTLLAPMETFLHPAIPFHPVAAFHPTRLGAAAASPAALRLLFVGRGPDGKPRTKDWGTTELPGAIAADIARLLQSGVTIDGSAIVPKDIAVLCRENKQAERVQEALRSLGVPSVLQTERSVFESAEAEEVERVLRAMADPGDAAALRAALTTDLLGVTGGDLYALEGDEARWEERMRCRAEWHDVWVRQGFIAAFRRVLDDSDVQARLLALPDGERRLTNVLHLAELLHTAALELHHGPEMLVRWLAQARAAGGAPSLLADDAAQLRLEGDADAVQLTTVHKSKGLEYPIVYCPFLWDGTLLHKAEKTRPRFHDAQQADRPTLDLGSDDLDAHVRVAIAEARAENLRLLYVALTRARHQCVVVWGAFAKAETSALHDVLHGVGDGALAEDPPLRARLTALADSAGGTIAVEDLLFEPGVPYSRPDAVPPPLVCLTTTRGIDRQWRTLSFSNLIAAGRLSQPAEAGLDHDAAGGDERTRAAIDGGGDETPVVLHQFPAGTKAGSLMHHVLEHLDFAAATPDTVHCQVIAALARFGFDARWAEALTRAVGDILDTPLGGTAATFALRQLSAARRLSEMEFVFPVARAGAVRLTGARLATLLARRGSPAVARYAPTVAALGFAPLTGYLRGFVDLIFEHQGRWYVADYKSNHLGAHPRDYASPCLAATMVHHHYLLQYHLYVVALHRHLQRRLAGYDYDRHFGGVYYLFLRGMSPAHPLGQGVFHDRPSRALVEDLSALLQNPEDVR